MTNHDAAIIRLAIVGCGAVTEKIHLPVAIAHKRVTVAALVDKSLERATALARTYRVPRTSDDYKGILEGVDAALVALPHSLHAPVSIALLDAGINVLVEKPMALTTAECAAMVSAAERTGSVLTVGLVRRFYPATQFVKRLLEEKVIGEITRFDLREGGVFDWPAVSDSFFRKDVAGGGVLVDTGVHVLDLLLWWLGDFDSFEYYDDQAGGVEANCEIRLRLKNGALGIVELSRTRNLRNTCILYGERGTLEVGTGFNSPLRLTMGDTEVTLTGYANWSGGDPADFLDSFRRQLDDFAAAILDSDPPLVPGREGMRSVELIEACYKARRPLELPWIGDFAWSRTRGPRNHAT